MEQVKVLTYNKQIKLLYGPNTHPGGDHLDRGHYNNEITLFNSILDSIKTPKPVMIEVGCFWAFWSLLFRYRFPGGENILIELGKRQLEVGLKNFYLNNFSCKFYWGGLTLMSHKPSGTKALF